MQFAGMNYLAIPVAAIAGFLFGAFYYTLLAGPWIKAIGFARKSMKKRPPAVSYIVAAVANLVMAWMLAGVVGHLGPDQVTIRNGVISAAFLWFGFVATTIAVNNTFGMRKPMLSVIDSGHWLGTLVVMGAIIGAFGV